MTDTSAQVIHLSAIRPAMIAAFLIVTAANLSFGIVAFLMASDIAMSLLDFRQKGLGVMAGGYYSYAGDLGIRMGVAVLEGREDPH